MNEAEIFFAFIFTVPFLLFQDMYLIQYNCFKCTSSNSYIIRFIVLIFGFMIPGSIFAGMLERKIRRRLRKKKSIDEKYAHIIEEEDRKKSSKMLFPEEFFSKEANMLSSCYMVNVNNKMTTISS